MDEFLKNWDKEILKFWFPVSIPYTSRTHQLSSSVRVLIILPRKISNYLNLIWKKVFCKLFYPSLVLYIVIDATKRLNGRYSFSMLKYVSGILLIHIHDSKSNNLVSKTIMQSNWVICFTHAKRTKGSEKLLSSSRCLRN